jgi:hypothetical protein
MLRVPDEDEDPLAELALPELPDETPVTTWSPAFIPETIWVFTPSVIPVTTVTGVTVPLRNTFTFEPDEIATFGTSTTLSADWVMIVTVAVMLGSSCTSIGSTEISTVYVTTLDVVVPVGSTAATVPVNVRFGYAVSVKFTF